jgi:hypothetical protein
VDYLRKTKARERLIADVMNNGITRGSLVEKKPATTTARTIEVIPTADRTSWSMGLYLSCYGAFIRARS